MSGEHPWQHVICAPCYTKFEPGRHPAAMIHADVEPCCWCGTPTGAGIYYRHDPKVTPCRGTTGCHAKD
jgi:hypothetical protein